jgi:hypothetical protein
LPRVYLIRSLVIMGILAGADLADGESVLTDDALVISLVAADMWLIGTLLGWLLARIARSAPVVDTVMMKLVIPHLWTFELVRKSKARMQAVELENRERVRREGRLS